MPDQSSADPGSVIGIPLASGLLRRIGQALERRNGPSGASRGLLRAGDLADRTRARLRGGRRHR
jgi:hypothetical protein